MTLAVITAVKFAGNLLHFPPILQSLFYKMQIFCIFLKKYFAYSRLCCIFVPSNKKTNIINYQKFTIMKKIHLVVLVDPLGRITGKVHAFSSLKVAEKKCELWNECNCILGCDYVVESVCVNFDL